MNTFKLRIYMTIIPTITAILFIILSFLFPDLAMMILSVEIVLLPSIYIVWNECTEQLLSREYKRKINEIRESTEELTEKYKNLEITNSILTGLQNESTTKNQRKTKASRSNL